MGHLSTAERVCSKTPIPSKGEGSPPLLSRRSKLSGDSAQARRGEDSSPELPPRDKMPLPKSLSSMKPAASMVPQDLVDHVPKDQIDLEEYTRKFQGDKVLGYQFQAPLKWDKVIQISLLHIVAVVCLFTYPLRDLNPYTTLWSFFVGGVAGFGVTAGAHRFWTHRSYTANTVLRSILMICYCVAGQNTLYDWVRDHRVHHKYSETDADPHNANRGFFFSHVGWLMMLKHPDVLRRGRQIDMSDVLGDPVVRFHQKYFIPLKIFLCFILPSAIPVYCWGESWQLALIQQCLFRYVSSLNFTWSVNSAAHLWGSRPYDKRIMPSENIYVSLVAMGEGWHNYHHVFPWDYKAAELGTYSFNWTTAFIDVMARIGQAYDLKFVSQEMVYKRALRTGDGSHIAALLDANNNNAIPTSELVAHLDHEKEEHAIWGWDDNDISEEDRKGATVVNKEADLKRD